MNNKVGFNRLGRRAGQRRALVKNLVTSLFKHERVETTKAKALEIRRAAEKIVTRAKVDSVHNRREVAKMITSKDVLAKLFTVLGPRFVTRPGGYTRILKLGRRFGDAAEMVILEFVERTKSVEEKTASEKAVAVKPAAEKGKEGKGASPKDGAKASEEKPAKASKTTKEKVKPAAQ